MSKNSFWCEKNLCSCGKFPLLQITIIWNLWNCNQFFDEHIFPVRASAFNLYILEIKWNQIKFYFTFVKNIQNQLAPKQSSTSPFSQNHKYAIKSFLLIFHLKNQSLINAFNIFYINFNFLLMAKIVFHVKYSNK